MSREAESSRATSKALGLLAAILTVISLIAGGVFWIVHENDLRAQGQALNRQAIETNTRAIQQTNDNFDKLIKIMSRMHGGKGD